MATWGYRVYTFKLAAGQDELSQELEANRTYLLDILQEIGKKTRIGKPKYRIDELDAVDENAVDAGEAEDEDKPGYERTQPTLTLRGGVYDQTLSMVHTHIALGEQGLHDFAINPDDGSDRLDVKSRSAETPRRTDFYFASAGFEGFLVTEVVGMKDPVPMLVKWIRRKSLDARNSRLEAIEREYETPDPDKKRESKTKARAKVRKGLRLKVERVSDPELLKQILNDINSMDIEYATLDEDNKTKNKRLIVKVREKRAQLAIVKALTGEADSAEIIRQTLEELDLDERELREANIDPEAVKAHVRSSEGNTTLVPGKLSELFNYRFDAAGRPGDESYYTATLAKLAKLKTPAQLPMQIPKAAAIFEWTQREEASWAPPKARNDA